MSEFRFRFAMLAAKCARAAIKALGRAASHTPGQIAIKICPDFMGHLKLPKTVICVTGTNGKTTTSNLITSVLRSSGYTVTNNSFGSNIQAGVCTALLEDSTLSGKAKKQVAVLEVDERSSLLIYKYFTPDILVCNNIMRDSLKRNAHTEFISYIINTALPESTHVILNADDFICSSLCPQNKKRTYFGLDAEKPSTDKYTGRDIVYCPDCGTRLSAEYVRYDHIGRLYCPGCGKKSPERDYVIDAIDWDGGRFTLAHHGKREEFKIVNTNIVNMYNCCGAIACLYEAGLSYEQISGAFEKLEIVRTRYSEFDSGDLHVVMQLSKGQNPVACARAFSYVASLPFDDKALLIMVDDKGDNTNNSESVCWIYDCDYSALANPTVKQIVFAGKRCRDQRERAVLCGVDPSVIGISDDLFEGAEMIDTEKYKHIAVCYDPYILAETNKIRKMFEEKGASAK